MKHLFLKYRYMCVLFLGIVFGTCYVNFIVKYQIALPSFDVYNSAYLEEFIDTAIQPKHLLVYIVRLRLRDYVLLWAAQFTSLAGIIGAGYILFIGIGVGIFISYAVMHFGIVGIFIYFMSVLPHYIFYAICIYIIFTSRTFRKTYYMRVSQNRSGFIMLLLSSFLMLILGIYIEAYLNPILLQWIYGHFAL